jgi:hypothetical protein
MNYTTLSSPSRGFKIASSFICILVMYCLPQLAQASSIIPFVNLAKMAIASDAVVLATATEALEVENNGVIRYRTKFKTISPVAGFITDEFEVQNMHLRFDTGIERYVDGEATFEIGADYLLFLRWNNGGGGYWQTILLSYGVFKQHIDVDVKLLAPVQEAMHLQTAARPDGIEAEPLRVYYTGKLVHLLHNVVHNGAEWDGAQAAAPFSPGTFHGAGGRAAPSYCNFMSASQPWPRWQDMSTTPLPVHYFVGGDMGCPSAQSKVKSAITIMKNNFSGVNLADAGTHKIIPNCSGLNGAAGGDFTILVNADLGGSRHVVIQFDDPCEEIPDLSGCAGMLSVGGTYYDVSATHVHDGIPWRNALYGYVIVNNGTGACLCDSGDSYTNMLVHEMTHALGLGHIDPAAGLAIMNASLYKNLTQLDIACANYIYAAPLPVELTRFEAVAHPDAVRLIWSTASETQNDHFVVERSVEGQPFGELGRVQGAGNSIQPHEYAFTDEKPGLGKNYYRLKQVDFNGKFEYSQVRVAEFRVNKHALSIYPNPHSGGSVQVLLASPEDESLELILFDMRGAELKRETHNVAAGLARISFETEQLPPGTYWLQAVSSGQTMVEKLSKQ